MRSFACLPAPFTVLALLSASALAAGPESAESDLAVVQVGPDGASVEIFRGDLGRRTIDVVSQCGQPAAGTPRIREYTVSAHQITITYGERSHVNLDLASGGVECVPD
jgi:hypothetical protein